MKKVQKRKNISHYSDFKGLKILRGGDLSNGLSWYVSNLTPDFVKMQILIQ